MEDNSLHFLVSSYTHFKSLAHFPKAQVGRGLSLVKYNKSSGLSVEWVGDLGPNIAFLLKHPKLNLLYATTETIDKDGEILILDISERGFETKKRYGSKGRSTCYLNLTNNLLTTVNYWDSKLVTFSLKPNGNISHLLNIETQKDSDYVDIYNPTKYDHWCFRQLWSHTHCMVTEPYIKIVYFVTDLSNDIIKHYKYSRNNKKLIETGFVNMLERRGPRHLLFHPIIQIAYIINELDSSITVCKYNPKTLSFKKKLIEDTYVKGSILETIQTISTLPNTFDNNLEMTNGAWRAKSHASEVRIHPNNKYLYASNRGHDSIVAYRINLDGTLEIIDYYPSGGKTPRNFNIMDNYILVGNQDSNNCYLFQIDLDTGKLTDISNIRVNSPNYILPIRFN